MNAESFEVEGFREYLVFQTPEDIGKADPVSKHPSEGHALLIFKDGESKRIKFTAKTINTRVILVKQELPPIPREDPTSLLKRIKTSTSVPSEGKSNEKETEDKQGSITNTISFLKDIQKRKNKDNFLKNYSFNFEELMEFENEYGHVLYENHIRMGENNQADLSVLTERKFAPNHTPHFAEKFGSKAPLFLLKCAEARKMLQHKYQRTATDSQLLQLMLKCPNEEIFWYIIQNEDLLMRDFLQKRRRSTR